MKIKLFFFSTFATLILMTDHLNGSTSSFWDMHPTEVRGKINQRIMEVEASTPSVYEVMDREIACQNRKTPIRTYLPSNQSGLPVIMLIHGGAWVAGGLDTHDNIARYFCSEAEAIVVSVGYTNAPEGKFPLPLQQCHDVLHWIREQGGEFSWDATKIAVVGDSAGGNMAAALCLLMRDQSEEKVTLQVLINPAVDLTCEGTIERQNDELDSLRWQAVQYLSDPSDVTSPYVSPILSKNLRGLPQAVVILAEKDDLREGGQHYADRLLTAGVPTHLYCQQGIGHLAGNGARASLLARESLEVAVSSIRDAFLHSEKPDRSKQN